MSLFLQKFNPISDSYKNFDFHRKESMMDFALKAIATATLITPIGIGCYECLRPKVKSEFDASDPQSRFLLVHIMYTVSTIAFNILYIGVVELWAQYPTRVLEILDQERIKRIDIDKLYSYQIPVYLMHPGVVESLKTIQISQILNKNSGIAGKLFEKMNTSQFEDYVYNIKDFESDRIPKMAKSILYPLGQKLLQDNRQNDLRHFARFLPLGKLISHPHGNPFLYSMTPEGIINKISKNNSYTLESLTPYLSQAQKVSLMRYFTLNPVKSKYLSNKAIQDLLSIQNEQKLKIEFFSSLSPDKKVNLSSYHEDLVLSLYSNEELFNIVSKYNINRQKRFIIKLSIEQLNNMNLKLFAKLYFSLVDNRELLRHVNIFTINQFVSKNGLEIALIDALPSEMLKKLNMENIKFCRRDINRKLGRKIIRLKALNQLEGILHFLHEDSSDISFLMINNFRTNGTCYTDDFILRSMKGVETNLMRLSDPQIYDLLWSQMPFIKNKILEEIDRINPKRAASLRKKFDYAPKASESVLMTNEDAFEILEIHQDADKSTAKKAYFKKAKKWHPDKGGNDEMFIKIDQAWKILKKYYDKKGVNQ